MYGTEQRAFIPFGNNQTINFLTTAVSQSLSLPVLYGTRQIRLVNAGSDITFINFSGAGQPAPAVTNATPLAPNSVEILTVGNDQTVIRAIGAAGGNTLYITVGEGL